MLTKTVDSKGRLTLGKAFARKLVMVDELADGTLTIAPAEAIPAHEAWIFKNPKVRSSLGTGLRQASEGQFADAPNLTDAEWLGKDEDED